jgi:plastocyanin
MTGMGTVTVSFGGGVGNNYDPECVKVTQGTVITFNGNFSTHPMIGGEVDTVAMTKTPASSGPFIPITNTGMSATFAFSMSALGNFPYYCDVHALGGMAGAVFVVP